jgi:hypothetical protein
MNGHRLGPQLHWIPSCRPVLRSTHRANSHSGWTDKRGPSEFTRSSRAANSAADLA